MSELGERLLERASEFSDERADVTIPRALFETMLASMNTYEHGQLAGWLKLPTSFMDQANPVFMAGYESQRRPMESVPR